ncbi:MULTISPECIES: xanthine dehydrogenase small subunit [unclassified Halomonas]|uniref:xanthine dehydrogenase small subunit n=1 Tax=unclassified Halomonas TaxID=2609666 RepID=UPI0007F1310E|nr:MULTISPECIES: xanthine dehydrogenase small subunit [unclassified Halomonas]SBR48589.1 xanthine dehydrogenase small subunit [Halomonas sp. HL-93]SNY96214.1 xanthine dehydrogenase small subunit [Halomonas sp. hl-4]
MATIEFLLNGTPKQCSVSPDTSILTLLRDHLGMTGTKEGCASGDCGACTVAICNPENAAPCFQSVNACITPAHQLHRRHVATIEGLAQGDQLHPAQQAMIECHGSQCGFCTPGIVMSLFTLHTTQQQHPAPLTPERLEAVLGGNLCRCTGYRPIRDAALSMQQMPWQAPQWFDASLPIAPPSGVSDVKDNNAPLFAQPTTLGELTNSRRLYPSARLVAGATDLWLENTQRLVKLDQLIDVSQVSELRQIEEITFHEQPGWWVGAGVTYTQLEPLLGNHFPAFAHLLQRLGSQQIRNRGTIGGNIANASPIGDTPPVLLALNAWVELANHDGSRQLPLSAFFIDYKKTALAADEVVSRVFIPKLASTATLRVWKLSKRREDDISAVLGAFCYRLEDGVIQDMRIAFGGMAATPKRALETEAMLEGQPLSKTSFQKAQRALADEFQPMSDVRGSQNYRQQAALNLLERLYMTLSAPDQEVMLHAYAH